METVKLYHGMVPVVLLVRVLLQVKSDLLSEVGLRSLSYFLRFCSQILFDVCISTVSKTDSNLAEVNPKTEGG